MSKIPCEIIQDLLPSYIDELTSDVTNREVEAHMTECEQCRNVFRQMKAPDIEMADNEEKETSEESDPVRSGCLGHRGTYFWCKILFGRTIYEHRLSFVQSGCFRDRTVCRGEQYLGTGHPTHRDQ